MTKKARGLGRGLDALLGEATPGDGSPSTLPLARLRPGRYQPRTRMNPEALAELAASIKSQGLMQPILVRPLVDGDYEIIAGERRFRAAQMAGLSEVPVLIKDVPDDAALAMALIENIQRENLNPLEEAQGVQRLIQEFSFTHEQAAAAIGRSRSATTNLLRLLNLAAPVQQMLLNEQLDMGHARALLAADAAAQVTLAHEIVRQRLNVREAEALVARYLRGATGTRPSRGRTVDRDLQRLEEELADTLGAVVKLQVRSKGRGRLIIEYASLDQLDGILARLRSGSS
ncbi:MAG: ParB/RepB/Spo0J family partition protein [Burkholderiaceae bacterium]|nr:ParB/RepB/Spo0J family partition protein [Burkholderiaceae bacterium]